MNPVPGERIHPTLDKYKTAHSVVKVFGSDDDAADYYLAWVNGSTRRVKGMLADVLRKRYPLRWLNASRWPTLHASLLRSGDGPLAHPEQWGAKDGIITLETGRRVRIGDLYEDAAMTTPNPQIVSSVFMRMTRAFIERRTPRDKGLYLREMYRDVDEKRTRGRLDAEIAYNALLRCMWLERIFSHESGNDIDGNPKKFNEFHLQVASWKGRISERARSAISVVNLLEDGDGGKYLTFPRLEAGNLEKIGRYLRDAATDETRPLVNLLIIIEPPEESTNAQ